MDTVNLPRVSDIYMYKLNLLYDVNLYNKAISKGKLLKYRRYLMCTMSSVSDNGETESEIISVESGKSDHTL